MIIAYSSQKCKRGRRTSRRGISLHPAENVKAPRQGRCPAALPRALFCLADLLRKYEGPGYLRGPFTTFCGFPARKTRMFSAVMSMMRWRLSFGAQEICGVMMQFFAVRSGLSGQIGSV